MVDVHIRQHKKTSKLHQPPKKKNKTNTQMSERARHGKGDLEERIIRKKDKGKKKQIRNSTELSNERTINQRERNIVYMLKVTSR